MAKETESNNKSLAEDSSVDLESCKEGSVASRRRFTRQAIMGSAVLFSLGNRPAWGNILPGCISDSIFDSVTAVGYTVSQHPHITDADINTDPNAWCFRDTPEPQYCPVKPNGSCPGD